MLSTGGLAKTHSPAIMNGQSHGIGAGGSVFWTWGFMYRQYFANNFGVTSSLGGWFDSRSGHIGNSLGLLYTLGHHVIAGQTLPNGSIRIYLVGYLANIFFRNDYFENPPYRVQNAWHIGLGAGPGLEFFFNQHFAVHAEVPWMTTYQIANKKGSFHGSHPHVGAGFIYYF